MAPYKFTKFVKDQWTKLPLISADLTGRNVIVVGANVGLGMEAARHFARMNPAKLILACRNEAKGQAALKNIQSTTGCKTLEVWPLDLANFASISDFVSRYEKQVGKLDLLLANAGVCALKFELTGDGWEKTLQTNHLGTSLLALLLIPSLSKSSPSGPFPRITLVSSDAHHFVKRLAEADSSHILNTLNNKEYCSQTSVIRQRYQVSKLLNVFFTHSLAARLSSHTSISINVVNPGLCNSAISREAKGLTKRLVNIAMALFSRSPVVGSRTLVHASLSGTQREMQGKYLNVCKVEAESDFVRSTEGRNVRERIWRETIEILEEVDSRVGDVVRDQLAML